MSRIWNVSFNAFHDQLILSASSDTQVNLQNLSSISSSNFDGREEAILESLKKENGEESQETSADDLIQSKTEDGLVAAYDPHEDSVYALAWSGADPWTFAALSFDGIVSVNTVPAEHKYKIIL